MDGLHDLPRPSGSHRDRKRVGRGPGSGLGKTSGYGHKGAKAREHLKEKFDYLERRRLITNAESFIERAASTSSMSGKPYLVRCAGGAAAPSGTWLTKELKRYRSVSGNGAS